MDPSPRNSREMEKDVGSMDPLLQRMPDRDRQDVYRYVTVKNCISRISRYGRYSRSPAKQGPPPKQHIETKTDYGKYR